jgi:UDP-N-acetylglucosamine diphosphorylase / glucose-1-phosphate thymidylyltransferase / UDP-N-acetylgalactosamine diphosphorylase / glucosamine-1-phosphate N-acetyltransferase / galactosamine-1-phosphate N-acetyltransferase
MSNPYAPDVLFDLDGFAHKALFDGATNAWDALGDRLRAYMDEQIQPGIEGEIEDGAFVKGKVQLAAGARIEAGAYVQGPAILGPGTVVRHGAYLREYTLAGRDCILGHSTEIKNAVFFDRASAGHFNYVGDSILGTGANLGAGVKLANFRVFPGNVNVQSKEGNLIATGLLKLGAIIGDDVQIGCNAVTSPGTVIGRGCRIYPLAAVRGTIAPKTLISYKPKFNTRPLTNRS